MLISGLLVGSLVDQAMAWNPPYPPGYAPNQYAPPYAAPGPRPAQPYAPGNVRPSPYPQQRPAPVYPQARSAPRAAQRIPAKPATVPSTPRPEVVVARESAYLLQPIVYTLRIHSEVNIATMDVAMPSIDGAAVEQLDGPRAYSEGVGGVQHIVTEVRYAITPFKAGDIHIPPARIKLKTRSGAYMDHALKLESTVTGVNVLSADNSVRPWLPLQDLRISGRHDASQQMRVGDPFTLTLTLYGTGMSGQQLPSLAEMLNSPDFKFYPEQPRTSHSITDDGVIKGKRIESFTVVPQRAGTLSLPVVDIAYWDTQRHRRARAVWSGMHINASNGQILGDSGGALHSVFFSDEYRGERDLKFFWLPMLLIFVTSVVVAYVMHRRSKARHSTGREMLAEPALWAQVAWSRRLTELGQSARDKVKGRLGDELKRPIRNAAQAAGVQRVVQQGDGVYRVWQCLRCVDKADDAQGLCRIMRRFACQYLRLPPNSSLTSIADAMHHLRPRLDQEHMRELFQELDSAAYGHERIDIPQWKKNYKRLLRKVMFSRRRRREQREARRKLPDLNPQV